MTTTAITYMTETAYWKRHNALSARQSRAYGRWQRWNDEMWRMPSNAAPSRITRVLDARDAAWHASIDAGNALAHFERTYAPRPAAR